MNTNSRLRRNESASALIENRFNKLMKNAEEIHDDLPVFSLTLDKTNKPGTYRLTSSLYLSDSTLTDIRYDTTLSHGLSAALERLQAAIEIHDKNQHAPGSYIKKAVRLCSDPHIKKSLHKEAWKQKRS